MSQTNCAIFVTVAAALTLFGTQVSVLGEVHVNNPGTGPDIYISWSGMGNPIEDTDFVMSFGDTANPDIELQTGNVTWNVRSENDDTSPGNIGTISLNPTSSTADFDLTILSGTDPGADRMDDVRLMHVYRRASRR